MSSGKRKQTTTLSRANMDTTWLPLIIWIGCIQLSSCSNATSSNVTTTATTPLASTSWSGVSPVGCSLVLADPAIRDQLSEALQGSTKLIKYNLDVDGYQRDVLIAKGGNLFRPYQWIRSTNRQGDSLLMLNDNFHVLSLSLLSIGVIFMDVQLKEQPYGCLRNLNTVERVNITRTLLLNDFKTPGPGEKSGSLSTNERICNMEVNSDTGRAEFVYHCCHIGPEGHVLCDDISRDIWINVLLVCIVIIKILVVLYSPSFIPESYYRKKFTSTEYIHHIPEGKKRKHLKIVKTMYPGSYVSQNPPVRLKGLDDLEYFKLSITNIATDKIYDLKLDRIHLAVKPRKLLSENYVPVSVMKMIYENVFRCKMRTISTLKPCCDTGVCGSLDIGCPVPTWYRCLRMFAKLVLLGILATPWIIRLVIYFSHEAVSVEEKRIAAERLGLNTNFDGSFTLYLTPLHGMFVAIYILVSLDSLAYGLLGKAMKERFKFILRKCLRDMRERSRMTTYAWAVGLWIFPFKRFGLVGFIIAPVYWVLLLIVIIPILAFYTFPALNLSIRLIIHLLIFMCPNSFVQKCTKFSDRMINMKEKLNIREIGEEDFHSKENMSKKESCLQLGIILMVLTSFWSLTFLLMECLSFFVEVGVYTLMGIIVNAGATLQYVTVLFLIWMYAKSSFSRVNKMYLDYHKIIRGLLLNRKKDEIKEAARQDEAAQESTAFRVQSSTNAADTSSGINIEYKDGLLRWQTSGLLVFLSSVDQPFTPAKFFFDTIDLNYCGCPGKLWLNTFNAFFNFMKIMVFLFFVVIVVLAFGNQFSTTNQMLATLAGGFVPFVFRNFFMKGSGSFTVDTDSVQFSTQFEKAIARFTQKWFISDIIPLSITESELTVERDTDFEVPELNTPSSLGNDSTTPLIGGNGPGDLEPNGVRPNDVRVDIDAESVDSEDDNTRVDLIIDLTRFDKHHRLIGMEGSLVNVGSLSMLGDGNVPIYKPPSEIDMNTIHV